MRACLSGWNPCILLLVPSKSKIPYAWESRYENRVESNLETICKTKKKRIVEYSGRRGLARYKGISGIVVSEPLTSPENWGSQLIPHEIWLFSWKTSPAKKYARSNSFFKYHKLTDYAGWIIIFFSRNLLKHFQLYSHCWAEQGSSTRKIDSPVTNVKWYQQKLRYLHKYINNITRDI